LADRNDEAPLPLKPENTAKHGGTIFWPEAAATRQLSHKKDGLPGVPHKKDLTRHQNNNRGKRHLHIVSMVLTTTQRKTAIEDSTK